MASLLGEMISSSSFTEETTLGCQEMFLGECICTGYDLEQLSDLLKAFNQPRSISRIFDESGIFAILDCLLKEGR